MPNHVVAAAYSHMECHVWVTCVESVRCPAVRQRFVWHRDTYVLQLAEVPQSAFRERYILDRSAQSGSDTTNIAACCVAMSSPSP